MMRGEFWERVNIQGEDECWEWAGARKQDGWPYGTLYIAPLKRYAHRIAWELANGPIPKGLQVCHACDNPPCCNPTHLFLGTQADNVRDCKSKGRVRNKSFRGEDHWKSKLTEVDVRFIRHWIAKGYDALVISGAFNVGRSTVQAVKSGQNWGWL